VRASFSFGAWFPLDLKRFVPLFLVCAAVNLFFSRWRWKLVLLPVAASFCLAPYSIWSDLIASSVIAVWGSQLVNLLDWFCSWLSLTLVIESGSSIIMHDRRRRATGLFGSCVSLVFASHDHVTLNQAVVCLFFNQSSSCFFFFYSFLSRSEIPVASTFVVSYRSFNLLLDFCSARFFFLLERRIC
jgi:hypothetical protein